jgi:hypothetical protein
MNSEALIPAPQNRLQRATVDICGAVLDYDQAHFCNLSAIICCIVLTFAFGMTGKLH